MATNTAAVISDVTKETMRLFENNLVFSNKVTRQFDDYFGKDGRKIGASLTVRLPQKMSIRTGTTFAAQNITDQTTTITQATQQGVDFEFTSAEINQSFDMISERYCAPAARTMAAYVDQAGMGLYKDIYNHVGTAGTTPATMAVMLAGKTKIFDQAGPSDELHFVGDSSAQDGLIVGQSTLFNNQGKIGDQYSKGKFGNQVFGLETLSASQSVNSHTAGTQGGTPLVNGASQTGTSLVTDGWTVSVTGVVKQGDVFNLPLVYSVNPLTKASTGKLQDFVVTADANSNGSGQATISFSPPLTTTTAYQTVTASPADNAAITFKTGSAAQVTPQNLIFHKDTFTLVMADLDLPSGGVIAAKRIKQNNYSLRLITYYDGDADLWKFRFDMLYGWKTLRPEWGARVTG